MFFRGFLLLALQCVYLPCYSILNEGELLFVGFNADGNDGFAVMAMVDIIPNSSIYFSDNEWNGGAIGSTGSFLDFNEGEMLWSTGVDTIKAGTVITFNEIDNSSNVNYGVSHGSISGSISLSANDEALYSYLGIDAFTPSSFITAISNESFSISGSIDSTNLDVNYSAVEFHGDEDVMIYLGSVLCDSGMNKCAERICETSNWGSENGTGDQSIDGGVDFPKSVPLSFYGTALHIQFIDMELTQKSQFIEISIHLNLQNNTRIMLEKANTTLNFHAFKSFNLKSKSDTIFKIKVNDKDPYEGSNYYRLNLDNGNSYSDIFTIEALSTKRKTVVFPNPFYSGLKINSKYDSIEYQIIDVNGIIKESGIIDSGSSLGENLLNGLYFLELKKNTGIEFIRILKE